MPRIIQLRKLLGQPYNLTEAEILRRVTTGEIVPHEYTRDELDRGEFTRDNFQPIFPTEELEDKWARVHVVGGLQNRLKHCRWFMGKSDDEYIQQLVSFRADCIVEPGTKDLSVNNSDFSPGNDGASQMY
jgi:hypothetical protein